MSECTQYVLQHSVSRVSCHLWRLLHYSSASLAAKIYYVFHGPPLPLHLAPIRIPFSAVLIVAWKTAIHYFRPKLFATLL